MCSLTAECVHLLLNVFSYMQMRALSRVLTSTSLQTHPFPPPTLGLVLHRFGCDAAARAANVRPLEERVMKNGGMEGEIRRKEEGGGGGGKKRNGERRLMSWNFSLSETIVMTLTLRASYFLSKNNNTPTHRTHPVICWVQGMSAFGHRSRMKCTDRNQNKRK